MSVYFFAPPPDISTKEQTFTTWENGFSDSQINDIIRIGDSLIPRNATVGGKKEGEDISEIRKSKTSWIQLNNETNWLYDSLAYVVRQLNGQFYEFNLSGFVEDFQYTVYDGKGDHYSWHIDKGYANNSSPRKLSLVLQLSDSSEYEGGDLEFFVSPTPTRAIKQKGLIYAFPSWILHRVTPVTSGVRRSLVLWVAGPKFK
jgi:PKHD-type hydroxylase